MMYTLYQCELLPLCKVTLPNDKIHDDSEYYGGTFLS